MTEILLIFILALTAGLVLWCLMGLLLIPVFGENTVTLYFSEGEGEALEQRVRAYSWLRDGRQTGGRMVLVDYGLNERGLEKALVLRERYPWVEYCPSEILQDYIGVLQDTI